MAASHCPDCRGQNLFRTKRPICAGGGYAPNYLPGLGSSVFRAGRFEMVICADCGLTRFYAGTPSREKLENSSKWERV